MLGALRTPEESSLKEIHGTVLPQTHLEPEHFIHLLQILMLGNKFQVWQIHIKTWWKLRASWN